MSELFCICSDDSHEDILDDILDDIMVDESQSIFSMTVPHTKLSLAYSSLPNKHLYEKDTGHKTLKKVIFFHNTYRLYPP
ncbi:hypothetical protein NQ314_019535 [Rhamnusium bicolor]|uniref:Uncharacterized protein n=1 Tax=Rhamnusium bicolor TaxID=1586634 RepID=A0AAV8WP26_9CUCU|nr:hypothetical protein NQ314_019535 [Rhamnusium bicolor]